MRLHLDSPPQVRAGINMIYTALLSSVYYAVKAVVDPTILPNSGLARPITVTPPLGTVMNASPGRSQWPHQHLSACCRSGDWRIGAGGTGTLHCRRQRLLRDCELCRRRPTRRASRVYLETIGGGSGARAQKDGLDGVHVHMTNTSNLPVEALEVEYPLTVLRYELVDGSGGAGRSRSGMGVRRVYRAEAECHLRLDGERLLTPPWELEGGQPRRERRLPSGGRSGALRRRSRQIARRRDG
jgi:N-methylhydantoinase B